VSLATIQSESDDLTETWSCYIPLAHPAGGNITDPDLYDLLADVLESRDTLTFQNAKYDIFSLRTAGIYIEKPTFLYDLATMANMLDDNLWEHREVSLEAMGEMYLGKSNKITDDAYLNKEKKTGNKNITPAEMYEYACFDASDTLIIGELLADRIFTEGLSASWKRKQDVIWLLLKMEGRGIKIDVDKAKEYAAEGRSKMAELLEQIGVTAMSNKQLKALLIDELHLPIIGRTAKGEPSFKAEYMEEYDTLLERMDSPLAKQISAYRGWMKATTASFEPYIKKVSPDGRLRANFNTHRTSTGRLSSSDPNLQQVPKEGDKPWKAHTKSLFIPEPGYVLVNSDFSQLELRLGNVYAGEPMLNDIFADPDRDLFSEMAVELGMPRPQVKTMVYALNYGAGVNKIARSLGVSKSQAQKMINDYFTAYPGFRRMMQTCIATVEQTKTIPIWSGRKRHFNYTKQGYKGWNSLIQGGAADIVECVMLALERELDDDEKCRMLLQVHDAVVFEIREDLVEEYLPKIRRIMSDVVGATGQKQFEVVHFDVDAKPDYGSKDWSMA